jgi:DNA modification methylase
MTQFTLHHGDCLKVLKTLPSCSVDAIVTDPPAGIAFMGKSWDTDKGGRDAWIAWMQSIAQECLRVIKPGGHALVWALPRTSHWTGMAWENAGWEPRDKVVHLFGTGFPKSLDVSKAIDKAAGAKREVVGYSRGVGVEDNQGYGGIARGGVGIVQKGIDVPVTASATPEAKQWEGWGTALKPAVEDWWLLRKPIDGTIAGNVAKHGTGALNIDACRIGTEERTYDLTMVSGGFETTGGGRNVKSGEKTVVGRWPANVITDGSDEVVAGFPQTTSGNLEPHHRLQASDNLAMSGANQARNPRASFGGDSGSAARFFYCAKASRTDRDEGCEHLVDRTGAEAVDREEGSAGMNSPRAGASRTAGKVKNHHPTVKHTELMRYLCRLITPPSGVVLDAFMGSGSTGKAAMLEGFNFIGIEQDAEYLEIAKARIEYALRNSGFADEVVVKPAPKAGSSLKVLRRKPSDDQIDLFAQPIASESQEVQ